MCKINSVAKIPDIGRQIKKHYGICADGPLQYILFNLIGAALEEAESTVLPCNINNLRHIMDHFNLLQLTMKGILLILWSSRRSDPLPTNLIPTPDYEQNSEFPYNVERKESKICPLIPFHNFLLWRFVINSLLHTKTVCMYYILSKGTETNPICWYSDDIIWSCYDTDTW